MSIRRPMGMGFLLLIIGIIVWQRYVGDHPPDEKTDVAVQCEGQVEEIQTKPSGQVLVVGKLWMVEKANHNRVEADRVFVYDSSEHSFFSQVKVGNIIKVAGAYSSFEQATNPGEFDQYEYYRSRQLTGSIFAEQFSIQDSRCHYVAQAFFEVRQRALEQLCLVMSKEDAGILGAMILGEKCELSTEVRDLYQRTGIGHILAISGLHISMLGAGLFAFLRKYLISMKKSVVVTILFLFLYGKLIGFPVATTRAVIMLICRLVARYTGKSYDVWSAMAFSGIIILVQQPLQLFQSGFLLSYAAIAGIHLFEPVMDVLEMKNSLVRTIVSSSVFFVVTLPLTLWFFYEICPYTVVVNLIILPILSLLIGLGIAGCVLSFVWQTGGEFILATSHYILKYYEWVCRMTVKLPFSRIVVGRPDRRWIVVYYLLIFAVVAGVVMFRKKLVVYVGMISCIFLLTRARPQQNFLYTQLDVGQGDCACIFYGNHTYMIDGGSSSEKEIGKYVLERFLKYYGRHQLDAVFVTHSDADHTNGILEMVERREQSGLEIQGVVVPEIEKTDSNYKTFLAAMRTQHIAVHKMEKGDVFRNNALSFSCLHPARDYAWENENDYSLTLDISYPGLRILATGDLESTGEESLALPGIRYDVLKVGHHGSKTSSSDSFLEEVQPRIALISCGKRNRYGHPSEEVLGRLNEWDSKVCCTTDCGAIMIDAEKMIRVYGYNN